MPAAASSPPARWPAKLLAYPKGSHRGVFIGSWVGFIMFTGSCIMTPFRQAREDALGCDALCKGGMTSMWSGLSLVGAAVVGRASDRFGRIPMLWLGAAASLLGLAINIGMDSIEGLWYAIVPNALLNQNFSVMKALFSDYLDEGDGSTDAAKASAVGKLGMVAGISFMAGPMLSTMLVSDYRTAMLLSAAVTGVGSLSFALLPTPVNVTPQSASGSNPLKDFVTLPVLRTPAAQLLMVLRLFMALAFHMFIPVWQVSLKTRFAFGPSDHATLFSVIGLAYALSQGLVAGPLVRKVGKDQSKLLLVGIVVLGGGRPLALWTSSLASVYGLYVAMAMSLGVMNAAISTISSHVADADQLGGFFGVMESVENVAGIVGPTLGGLLAQAGGNATAAAVVGCYAMAFLLVLLFFEKHVAMHTDATAAAAAKKAD